MLFSRISLFVVVAVGAATFVETAIALPPIRDQFTEQYDLAKKASCYVCHVKGMKKTARNEYGKALSHLMRTNKSWPTIAAVEDDFKARKAGAKADVAKLLKQLELQKSEAGPTFSALIKARQLPGM